MHQPRYQRQPATARLTVMPDETLGITESYQDIIERLDRIERHMRALLQSFASGGLRGFRAAAREMANDGH